ncbi:2491_t:CDS:2 [Ambispora gerdemannii]|uniref:2491_t:CDS:1 n=1 Tax=Ambispora gerdemannii TaxID=144530 RepID=A0A9N9EJ13_9GLOM|nr:2491_t:CDS:2 [Ambispora gerdemannii]
MPPSDKYIKTPIQFTAFFILVKTYQKISNLSFIANMKALSMTFSYATTACVKKVSMNDGHNLPKMGIQTTSRVKGLNSIVKRLLTASSSLCDLVDAFDARLQDEVQWNQFFEYQTMSSCMGIVSVDHDLFSEIDKKISKYLTLHILSVERLEISQCLYFIASQMNIANNNDEDSNLIVMDGFIENSYDAKQILLKSIIAEVGEENVREV